jgi:hypothetical protein
VWCRSSIGVTFAACKGLIGSKGQSTSGGLDVK